MSDLSKLPGYRYVYLYDEAPTDNYIPSCKLAGETPTADGWRDDYEASLDAMMVDALNRNHENIISLDFDFPHPADKLLRALIRHPEEFRLGFDEGDGDVGMTYDDDPSSERSAAYDMGRSYKRGIHN
jgi:hypothetical protein